MSAPSKDQRLRAADERAGHQKRSLEQGGSGRQVGYVAVILAILGGAAGAFLAVVGTGGVRLSASVGAWVVVLVALAALVVGIAMKDDRK